MPDKIISIPYPVLKTGESFYVRYKMQPSGSWVDVTPQTNAPFTLYGLTVGNYILEVALVISGVPCAKKYYNFKVEEPCECPPSLAYTATFDVYGNVNVTVTSGVPSPKITGYEIIIVDGNGQQSVNITPNDLQNYSFSFPETIGAYNIIIKAICGKYVMYCKDEWMNILPAPCMGISGTSATVIKMVTAIGTIQYYLRILLTQSTPKTLTTTVSFNQTDKVVVGVPDGGSAFVGSVGAIVMIPITPNINVVSSEILNYSWRFTDICGNIITGTATGMI